MQRLFAALSIPETTAQKLTALQPGKGGPIRVVEGSLLHITLHFIGQAETRELAGILEQVQARAFSLQIDGLGKFSQTRGACILWAGVQKNEGLMTLYQKIAAVLSQGGFTDASIDYVPHITLARCKNGTPGNVTDSFINQPLPPIEPFTVTKFGLYSSKLYKGTPLYECEREFSLELP